ncbi:DUF1439 domain-containing protein [Ottowia sp.]|uniref:DUF1439 domain-containing protein n=1 Tax=Ottowia sp. TaxID=1898956 RepID=UPI003A835604
MSRMKWTGLALVALLLAAGVGAYVFNLGKEYPLRFSEAQIQQRLSEKLPLTKTYLFIFQITLKNPRVQLQSGSNRVNAGLDIDTHIRVGQQSQTLGGAVDVTAGVQYKAETGEFFLVDPVIERLSVQGIPAQYEASLTTALTQALAAFYASHPVYTLNARDMKQVAAKAVLKRVLVEDGHLNVVLGL